MKMWKCAQHEKKVFHNWLEWVYKKDVDAGKWSVGVLSFKGKEGKIGKGRKVEEKFKVEWKVKWKFLGKVQSEFGNGTKAPKIK